MLTFILVQRIREYQLRKFWSEYTIRVKIWYTSKG